jgi:carbon storage regulator
MLVLSRKRLESIVIDGRVKVTVLSIKGNQVRLGIEAPGDMGILRGELVVTLPPVDSGEAGSAAP